MIGVCKFCGCTEDRPCVFRMPDAVTGSLELFPCTWLLPDLCTAPICVEKAYIEARALAESILDPSLVIGVAA